LAAKIKSMIGHDVDLVPGARGAFEVIQDDKVVFSKLKLGRFPNSDDEVVQALHA
jgi:selT/selW/selH-like putative selenoprotein